MLLLRHCGLIALSGCALAFGQTFEAASVKVFDPSTIPMLSVEERRALPGGGPGSKDPGRIHYPRVSLLYVLLQAYDTSEFQLQGPAWLGAQFFNIDATLPADTTRAQFRVMLQNLLQERFHLDAHSETKELSGYSLVVKGKLKVKESAGPAAPENDGSPVALKLGPDNYFVTPERQGVFFQLTGLKSARSTFRQVTMKELANTLQNQLKRPVADATGLSGKYDFVLSYATEGLYLGSGRMPVGPGGDETAPDLVTALSEQLGLKLESRKVSTEVVVIDHIERAPVGT